MHEIKNLESRWNRYHQKRKTRFYFLVLSVLIIVSAILGLLTFLIMSSADKKENKRSVVSINTETINKDSTFKLLHNDSFKTLEKNYLHENKKNEPIAFTALTARNTSIVEKSKMLLEPNVKLEAKNTKTQKQEKSKKEVKVKKNISIVQNNNISAYKEVEKRFKKLHKIEDALFLARGYYKHRKYKKAEDWAFKVNSIDANIEESWIIFAKSKMKLGKKKMAIKILELYITKSNSLNAKKLLSKIKKNSFK